ncbi:MAG: hypothetical protein CMP76_10355 [Flavobacterium sp.]|uniref:Uncharacterized protein n=1 Tax=Flavobacterium profundi TaxID=1774945 RepID=A0A6I4IFT6_9FLAO|nr:MULTISPECIES: hypothetical protein [Flavobacterium]MBF03686.1 hypothetical protein [Flavobacterium sp.]MCO6163602.1 hypothetical protein [Flavobacterium sp. NRK F7]MVO08474.1 hypothetical protein [Flavobacterium profundi]|tara:strand:- start:2072 stop:2287 length:216 start_codon:yes stop_codon:yes gene_type:complete
MKATKIIGIVLIALSLYVGYLGVNKVSNNTAEVKFLGIEIDASNESGQTQGFIFIGLAVALFVGGLYTVKK